MPLTETVRSMYDESFKGIVVIHYISWAKGHGLRFKGGVYWCAQKDGDVVDYNFKSILIKSAKESGDKYVVIRHHKKGGASITEKNY